MTLKEKEPDSFSELPFKHFPSLPHDSYIANPTERATLTVPLPRLLTASSTDLGHYLHLAWALVLVTHTGSDEVLFGSAHHGRCAETGAQAMMPFRLRVSRDATVSETVASVASYRRHIANWEHLGLPQYSTMGLELITMCRFRNLFILAGPEIPHPTPSYAQKYPLAVFVEQESSIIHVHAVMDPQLLPSDIMNMILTQFADILTAALDDAKCSVRDLQSVGPRGWNKLVEWNRRSMIPSDLDASISDLIETRLRTHATATAVCAWDGTLTYHDLNQWASAVATQLVDKGITPGSFVGVYLDKSVAAVVAMVAIIKAGGALAFLSPSVPRPRLRLMCNQLPVRLVLTTAESQEAAAALGVPTLLLEPNSGDECSFYMPVGPHQPLYAIFTSGSTGEPKAVFVQRGSYSRGMASFCQATGLNADSRIFQAVSYMFVVSMIEQLNALSAGACICVPSSAQLQNDMAAAMRQLQANWCMLTPSWARTLDPSQLPQLRRMLLTGEAYTYSDVQRWTPHAELYTVYGQSEAATTVFVKSLQGLTASQPGLGHISSGASWVVDPDDPTRLRPLGTEGELLIDSPALANGYLHSPEQTAVTFIDPPGWLRALRPDGKDYPCLRTGDLVRYQDLTGSLQPLGRKGTQAKIRGQRVDLCEVETSLSAHFPAAEHLFAGVVHPAGHEEEQDLLVALVQDVSLLECAMQEDGVVEGLGTPSSSYHEHARRAIAGLRQLLPSYMVPSAIIPVRDMPVTNTGKVARKALLDRVARLSVREILSYNGEHVPYRAPSMPQEQVLQEVCEDLLGLSPGSVGMDDNFFHVGGDSMSARQLSSKARARGLYVTVADIFDRTTFAELAHASHLGNAVHSTVVQDTPDPFMPLREAFLADLPPSITQEHVEQVLPTKEFQRIILGHQFIDHFPISITGEVDRPRLREACKRILHQLAVLRSIFTPFHGQIVQVILRHIELPWEELDVPEGEEIHGWVQAFFTDRLKHKPPMDQPSVKFTLVQSPQTQQLVLVIRMSHAIYDGGCLRVLAEHLSTAYNDQALAVQCCFATYMRVCARLSNPDTFAFWRMFLADAQVTRLPRSSLGHNVPVIHPGECTPSSPPMGVTMATAVKAAWSYVLRQHSGHTDVLFGQIGNCRGIDLPGAPDIMGMCLNVSPVRVQYETLPTVLDLFRAIQAQHAQTLDYHTTDWQEIVQHSTSWPADTDLDSVVLHENFGNIPTLQLGKAAGEIGNPIFTTPAWKRITLITWPGAGKMALFLMCQKGVLEEQLAQRLVTAFTATLEKMLDFPNASIASLDSDF